MFSWFLQKVSWKCYHQTDGLAVGGSIIIFEFNQVFLYTRITLPVLGK
jgi:hypothetical protein